MPPPLSDEIFQAYLDTYLGTVIVQAFLSGLYTFLLFRTIRAAVPNLRRGTHTFLMTVLMFLYIIVMTNFAFTWVVVRSVLITQGEKQQSIAEQIIFGSFPMLEVVHGTQIAAMIIADTLLVWRCYIVWLKNKWLLVPFGILLVGEVALFPTYFVFDHSFSFAAFPAPALSFISSGITVICTSMIIYRILTVSRGNRSVGRYGYIIEILVESGILYSAPLLITGVMMVFHTDMTVSETSTYLMVILIPITGIAPTLISEHAMTNAKRDQERWSQPVATLRFRHTTRNATHQESDVNLPH
ncbi:hypothetical protein BDQ17DRAFT_1434349 [Cyathus striatus]|nr:hypothetical protein BDQ17DRAFT_1434349 [Cyathus striatus]